MSDQSPPAGWYPHPTMADTLRYWDGDAWTEHIAPAGGQQAGPQRACPYCGAQISESATRCNACAGQLYRCPRCVKIQGAYGKSKFVGIARGGTKTQYRCIVCHTVVAGPRW